MLHVALRPDHNSHLIAYPHCEQDCLDASIPFVDACKESFRGLGKEKEAGVCLSSGVLIRGNNRYGTTNGSEKDNFTDELFPARDPNDPDATPSFSLRRGSLRIVRHDIPHGTTLGCCPRCRCDPVPSYVGIAPDHMTLDYPNLGTWQDVADAHERFLPTNLSGYDAIDKGVPEGAEFPVHVEDISALSDALVGRRRMYDEAVVEEMERWFGDGFEEMRGRWMATARMIMETAWQEVKNMERWKFGKGSLFLTEEEEATVNEGGSGPAIGGAPFTLPTRPKG